MSKMNGGNINKDCGLKSENLQWADKEGNLAQGQVSVTTNYDKVPVKQDDGSVTTVSNVSTTVDIGGAVGKRNYERSKEVVFEVNASAGPTQIGLGASLTNTSMHGQSRNLDHQFTFTEQISAEHKQVFGDMRDLDAGNLKDLNPQYAVTTASLKIGPGWKYRNIGQTDAYVGGIFAHTLNMNGETKNPYNTGGVTFGGSTQWNIPSSQGSYATTFVKLDAKGTAYGKKDANSPLGFSLSKPAFSAMVTIGIKF